MMRVFYDLDALSLGAAEFFVQQAEAAMKSRGRFVLALAGGHTPGRTYELLAQPPFRSQVDWARVHIFWGDERCVPLDDLRSNARMAQDALLNHVPVPFSQIHPMMCRESPGKDAQRYEALLRGFFSGSAPCFDLVLLGLGTNGHTASLFPHTAVLTEQERWVSELYDSEQNLYRITLTSRIINQAAAVVFLVAGADKAGVLQAVLQGPQDPMRLPAQFIRPVGSGELHWFVDQAAASWHDSAS
ncbi:MAG: 6-phosphogluconolactonase [Deltaproteobacteria bacterium]|nr:6-phosphogluconolactonase [Deltaproteobacteria bacterium]